MAIPEQQLETWAHQGAVQTSAATHQSIRTALGRWPPLQQHKYDVYLQGSYKNSTNIYGDSDVDVVVQLDESWVSDLSGLPQSEQSYYWTKHHKVSYSWKEFRADVLAALLDYYGPGYVKERPKCIKVLKDSGRLDADVVVCQQYRRYWHFNQYQDSYTEGMTFNVPAEGRWVINYPKWHYQNGVDKHSSTREWYKPTVRMFKNARLKLVADRKLDLATAPSYFVECLTYNVGDGEFGGTWTQAYRDVLYALIELLASDTSKLVCQNKMVYLFGNTPEQWSEIDAVRFVLELKKQWDNW